VSVVPLPWLLLCYHSDWLYGCSVAMAIVQLLWLFSLMAVQFSILVPCKDDSNHIVVIRECGSVLYLGMATEILNLPYFCITQIMAKEATNPKPSMQRE